MMQKLKEAENTDKGKPGQEANEDFFKGFEQFVQNIGSMGPENMQVSEEELSKASQMFKDMFNEHQDSSKQSQPENSDKEEKIGAEDKSDTSNPLLKGYENLSKDASNVAGGEGMPKLEDLNAMFEDSEFQTFMQGKHLFLHISVLLRRLFC